jgi:carbohydrate kinase (thermoresistant glucokinase family)
MEKEGAIISCSALKEKYRVVLSRRVTVPVFWVFLHGNYELIERRMKVRSDHFMPSSMLASQFDALEIPRQCIQIDISQDPDKIVEMIISQIGLLN